MAAKKPKKRVVFTPDMIRSMLDELVLNIHKELDILLLEDELNKNSIARLSIQRGTIERIRNVFEFEINNKENPDDSDNE